MKWKRILSYLLLTLLLSACLLIADCLSYRAGTFNERGWLNSGIRGRGRMADDLVNRCLLMGKTKKEFLASLGKPDREESAMVEYQVAHIPRCSWFWNCYVQVSFDGTDKVTGALISD